MTTTFEPALALSDTVDLFEQYQLRYFLVGSFASGFRGEFRATNDLDIVCEFRDEVISSFVEKAKEGFYCDEISLTNAVKERRSCNLIHEQTFVKVDLFTFISQFENEQFSLCSSLEIPGTKKRAHVSTAEYNIIAKINWYLKSNRVLERQIRDVKSMVAINKDSLDYQYLERWGEYFKISEFVDSILKAA